jgi:hypothetical protein
MLADHIVESLKKRTGRFDALNKLKAILAEDEVKYTAGHLPVALEILVGKEWLKWPEVGGTKPSPRVAHRSRYEFGGTELMLAPILGSFAISATNAELLN